MDLTQDQIKLIKPIAERFWREIVAVRREAHTYDVERKNLASVVTELETTAHSLIKSDDMGGASLRSLNERIKRYRVIIEHLQGTVQWHYELASRFQNEMLKKIKELGIDLAHTTDEWPEVLDDMF